MFSINQGTNEDDSQSNPHPEAGLLTSRREDCHDMAARVQRERESTQAYDTSPIRYLLKLLGSITDNAHSE